MSSQNSRLEFYARDVAGLLVFEKLNLPDGRQLLAEKYGKRERPEVPAREPGTLTLPIQAGGIPQRPLKSGIAGNGVALARLSLGESASLLHRRDRLAFSAAGASVFPVLAVGLPCFRPGRSGRSRPSLFGDACAVADSFSLVDAGVRRGRCGAGETASSVDPFARATADSDSSLSR